jgi:hypothetical protein
MEALSTVVHLGFGLACGAWVGALSACYCYSRWVGCRWY